jgi:hypothetical protein
VKLLMLTTPLQLLSGLAIGKFILSRPYSHIFIGFCLTKHINQFNTYLSTSVIKYFRIPLIRTLVIRIGLVLRENLSRILQNKLALKLPVIESSKVQWLLELQIRRDRKV